MPSSLRMCLTASAFGLWLVVTQWCESRFDFLRNMVIVADGACCFPGVEGVTKARAHVLSRFSGYLFGMRNLHRARFIHAWSFAAYVLRNGFVVRRAVKEFAYWCLKKPIHELCFFKCDFH